MIHMRSTRRNQAFIKVNCAALPGELLESELFGFEQGAFTGAVRSKPGKFELATKGTIFLDEIAEMSPHLQAKLLHVLQDHQFSRLGGRQLIDVDVRVLAATNVEIQEAMKSGRLREDLYYRLNVLSINVPPLRERATEIPLLFRHFLQKYSEKFNKEPMVPSQHLMEAALRYPWPGNLRELENFVKRYVILEDDEGSFRELLEMSATRQRISPREEPAPVREQGLKALVRSLKDEAEMEAIGDALGKKLIGAARMQPRCWASATRRCSIKFASLDWIPGAHREPIIKKRVPGENLRAQAPCRPFLHQREGIARGASTCNQFVNRRQGISWYFLIRDFMRV